MADLAGNVHIGQKVHFDFDQTVSAAGLAAAALGVEGEPSGAVAARSRVLRGGKQIADIAKEAGICRGVRAGTAPDRALVDADDLIEVLEALNAVKFAGSRARAV